MADQLISKLSELKKREQTRQQPKRNSSNNIFDGQSQFHRARIGEVDAVRLSVAPSGQPVPQSMSIATVFDWRPESNVNLPMSIKWVQTSAGCWDFSSHFHHRRIAWDLAKDSAD